MTTLLTGASGLIGGEFLRVGASATDVVPVGRDLGARDLADRLPARADAIVHLAQSRRYRDFPEGAGDVIDVNVAATARLLDYARRAGVRRFVFASTATIYEPSAAPLSESAPVRCTSFYAASKRAAELIVEQYAGLMMCWVVRIFTVYGAGQRDQLIAQLVRRVRTGEPVSVQGRVGLPLSPIHAADVAQVLASLAAPGEWQPETGCEVVNVGGRESLGVREIAEQIGTAVGIEPRFAFDGEDPPGWIADRGRLDRMLPELEPRRFAEGIAETVRAAAASR